MSQPAVTSCCKPPTLLSNPSFHSLVLPNTELVAFNRLHLGSLRQSRLATSPRKQASQEPSINAALLERAGFISKIMAGVYSFLPLGLRVLKKIENAIRSEMMAIGGQEVLLPSLHPRALWEKTGRWSSMDVLFKLKVGDRDVALGPTHEEVVTPTLGAFLNSYRTLPLSVYQFQTKFRNELRAKAGLLRGREFSMKDMYSFHATAEDLDAYYSVVRAAYERIFHRVEIGDKTYFTYASGGTFSKFSHEFQTLCESGEDTIAICQDCGIGINREIQEELCTCPECSGSNFTEHKAIETANIFKLMTRFSNAFELGFLDATSTRQEILMGCYGLGPSRLMGTIVETHYDTKGMIWPASVAPFNIHLLQLGQSPETIAATEKLFETLQAMGCEVLFDDRKEVRAGQKFGDAESIGIPITVIASDRSLSSNSIEIKSRKTGSSRVIPITSFLDKVRHSADIKAGELIGETNA